MSSKSFNIYKMQRVFINAWLCKLMNDGCLSDSQQIPPASGRQLNMSSKSLLNIYKMQRVFINAWLCKLMNDGCLSERSEESAGSGYKEQIPPKVGKTAKPKLHNFMQHLYNVSIPYHP